MCLQLQFFCCFPEFPIYPNKSLNWGIIQQLSALLGSEFLDLAANIRVFPPPYLAHL